MPIMIFSIVYFILNTLYILIFFQKSWSKCVCGKTFPDKKALQRHQSAYLCGKDKLPINCNECGFFLGYQGTDMALKTHKKHMLKEHPEFVKVSQKSF